MAFYEPPIETVPEFDVLLFKQDDTPLTIGTASKLFLRFPNAQGEENLAKTNVSGLLTANGGMKVQQVDSINVANPVNLFTSHTSSFSIGNGFATMTNFCSLTDHTGIIDCNTIESRAVGSTVALYNNTTTGTIGIGTGQTSGLLNIGTANRTTAGQISIGTGLTSDAAVCIGRGAGAAAQQGSLQLEASPTQNIRLGRLLTTGDIQIGQGQTDGRIEIGFGASRTPNGIINIGNNASAACPINIGGGSGAITITGSGAGSTTVSSGSGGTSLQSGGIMNVASSQVSTALNVATATSRSGAVNISTGSSSSAPVNISTGASNSGDVSISTGATATGDVFIGNSGNTVGTTFLQSRNIEIGTNGVPSSVISLSAPLRPTFTSTSASNLFMVGFQNITANSTTVPTNIINNIANTGSALDNGVWLIEGIFGATWTGTPTDSLIVWSISTTSATNDNTRLFTQLMNRNLISSVYQGMISTIIRLTTAQTVYLVAQVNGTNPNSCSSAIRYTRLA